MDRQSDGIHTEIPAKPGRRAQPPDPDSGPYAALAHELWQLKRRAGDPSFAAMCTTLGAAASRSSLAAATRGTALPSWETTWEFVRVLAVERLGADTDTTEREWWGRWTAARDAGRASPAPVVSGEDATVPRSRFRWPRRRSVVASAAGVLIVGLTVAGTTWTVITSWRDTGRAAGDGRDGGRDNSVFVGETIADGTRMRPGKRFVKTWTLRNVGTVRWEGRWLTRVNTTPCSSPERVPVPTTEPGGFVTIAVPVTASAEPARCKSYWKMTDSEERLLLPGKNPVYLEVVVTERP